MKHFCVLITSWNETIGLRPFPDRHHRFLKRSVSARRSFPPDHSDCPARRDALNRIESHAGNSHPACNAGDQRYSEAGPNKVENGKRLLPLLAQHSQQIRRLGKDKDRSASMLRLMPGCYHPWI